MSLWLNIILATYANRDQKLCPEQPLSDDSDSHIFLLLGISVDSSIEQKGSVDKGDNSFASFIEASRNNNPDKDRGLGA